MDKHRYRYRGLQSSCKTTFTHADAILFKFLGMKVDVHELLCHNMFDSRDYICVYGDKSQDKCRENDAHVRVIKLQLCKNFANPCTHAHFS